MKGRCSTLYIYIHLVLHSSSANIRPKILGGGETFENEGGAEKIYTEKWIWGEAFQQPHSKKGVVLVLLLGLCDRELELVGHDHGSENNVFQSKKEKEKSFPSKKKISPRFEFKIKLSL